MCGVCQVAGLCELGAVHLSELSHFLTTIGRLPISAICKDMHTKATDTTAGMYRDLTITKAEHSVWKSIKPTKDKDNSKYIPQLKKRMVREGRAG